MVTTTGRERQYVLPSFLTFSFKLLIYNVWLGGFSMILFTYNTSARVSHLPKRGLNVRRGGVTAVIITVRVGLISAK